MILIADSGSTKTAWRLIDGDKNIHQVSTQGFNPYFQDTKAISEALKTELLPNLQANAVSEIYYYGAGCSSPDKIGIVEHAIKEHFTNAKIEVEHDLLAAARAVCGHKPGIAAILGTGSNSCYYDGEKIAENVASLGFILGDEGSGAHIGKAFITAYLNNEVPAEIAARFYQRFQLHKNEILDAVYKKPMPSRFLASFAKFIFQNIKEPYMLELSISCFTQFFDKHICKYEKHRELKLSIVGSVGFYFSDIIRKVAQDKSVEIDKFLESPIAGLTLYHLGEV